MASRSTGTGVLILLQFNASLSSRTFFDHESLSAALDRICALYEKELKTLNPNMANITYDIADLYTYLDALHNVSLLLCVPVRRDHPNLGALHMPALKNL